MWKVESGMTIKDISQRQIKGFSDIRRRSSELMEQREVCVNFQTTAALKKNSEFLIFPDTELILKNWWNSWNNIFPETPLEDEDALRLLLRGTYITSYHLSSSTYRMKGNNIKGFYGTITLGSRLAAPMKELLNALLVLSEYSGTGVKTALGMGKTVIGNI